MPNVTLSVPLLGTIGLGNASKGLCGGMSYVAADLFHAGRPVPADQDNPGAGTPLFQQIVSRFIDSVDPPFGIAKAYMWMASGENLAVRTWEHELMRIQRELYLGKVVPVTLIRMHSLHLMDSGHNHQVVVYQADWREGKCTLRLYECNRPDDDTVSLVCSPDSIESDMEVRGLYVNVYSPKGESL